MIECCEPRWSTQRKHGSQANNLSESDVVHVSVIIRLTQTRQVVHMT